MLSFELPKELEERFEALAKEAGRTSASLARRIILDYLEDSQDSEIAEKTLDEFYKSGGKIISHADVKKKHGLDR